MLLQLRRATPAARAMAVIVVLGATVLAQGDVAPVNNLPNPYRTVENYFKMPSGRTWGATSAVEIDKDGRSIWVAERCGVNTCRGSNLASIFKFDASGRVVKSFGEGLFNFAHGIFVDREGNLWVSDGQETTLSGLQPGETKGHQVFKFSPEGTLLMTIGQRGGALEPGYFFNPNDVLVAPDGSIFVSEGHGDSPNSRILKFAKDGALIKTWGKKGSGPGEFNTPHALAMDSRGRLFVGDRGNNRIQIFDQEGRFLDAWKQFSRPSGIYIDRHDDIYVADSESGSVAKNHAEWKRGIRIGSAIDGSVRAFIPDPHEDATGTSAAEGVAVDVDGNVYGAEVGPRALKKYVKTDVPAQAQRGAPARQTTEAPPAVTGVAIDDDDIGGVVTSAKGPEAGVWVIAETDDLPTKFRKIVVTDDRGRYLVPDLPKATYRVWVRGYGLVDSPAVSLTPGRTAALRAVVAPTAIAAAQYYPANYWYSLINVPPKSAFPGTGPAGNGIGVNMQTQDHWINVMKTGCETCHQIGTKATREIPESLGKFRSTKDAWDHRAQTGQDGVLMTNGFTNMGRDKSLSMYADWTDRVNAGEVPPAPPRPQGVERNLVLTSWDWGTPRTFAHDELATDKRHPTANANGPIYGVDWGNDDFLMVDPVTHTSSSVRVPVLEAGIPAAKSQEMPKPSPYWGADLYWNDPANPNHLAMDTGGRIWITARFRAEGHQPAYCADHPSARFVKQDHSFRQLEYYDPKTKTFTQVNTCFDTHHISFAGDADETIYANGVRNHVIGWVKTKVLRETGDEARAQGWCKGYFDVNGDGRIDVATEPPVPMTGVYGVAAHPDGSVWGAVPAPMPGRIIRIDPKTCIGEAYEPPFLNPDVERNSYTPRGIDIDRNGLIWTALAGSGDMASFDRSKCKVRTGPDITNGQHCPEGWTIYPVPGPRFKGTDIGVDYHYYNWVDQFNVLGLGENTPLTDGTGSDSLLALDRATNHFVTLRVPYPMNFYQRGLDGRIDDPNGGWKGRGLYATYGENAVWHIEGGKGTRSALVKFQLRNSPLDK